MTSTHVLIVGGGLAGLALADHLQRTGVSYRVVEARQRWGGRIFGVDGIDLGPSWFWSGQPRMAHLTKRLRLHVFEQFAKGALRYEDETGRVHHDVGYSSMAGSLRVRDGMAAITDALASGLDPHFLHLGGPVTRIAPGMVTLADGRQFQATHIVLAIPPRVAATLTYTPALPLEVTTAMQAVPTWMGGQAKIVALYETPFWRDAGLSGDAMSRHGPLVEIHDATAMSGTPAALFGFVGAPAPARLGQINAIKSAALAQLVRLFGQQAGSPRKLILQDWATEAETAGPQDQTSLMQHPDYGPQPAFHDVWGGTLHLGSTEVAPDFGGYLEGALSVAETLARQLR